jgi:hypothetical protein
MATHDAAEDIAEHVERQMQLLAIAAATLAARKAISHRQGNLARARADSETRAADLRAQLDSQRTLASARLQPVFDNAWWQTATPAQAGEMWQETTQWCQTIPGDRPAVTDPTVFDRASDRIQQEARGRWKLDVHEIAAPAYADNLAEHERLAATNALAEVSASNALTTPTQRYDTHGRRERLRQRMVAIDIPEDAIQARLLANTAQQPP